MKQVMNEETMEFYGWLIADADLRNYLLEEAKCWAERYSEDPNLAFDKIREDVKWLMSDESDHPFAPEFMERVDCDEIAGCIFRHVCDQEPLRPLITQEFQKRRIAVISRIQGDFKPKADARHYIADDCGEILFPINPAPETAQIFYLH